MVLGEEVGALKTPQVCDQSSECAQKDSCPVWPFHIFVSTDYMFTTQLLTDEQFSIIQIEQLE